MTCAKTLWDTPCDICQDEPCTENRSCWASPPLHLFPYETYYAERVKPPAPSSVQGNPPAIILLFISSRVKDSISFLQ